MKAFRESWRPVPEQGLTNARDEVIPSDGQGAADHEETRVGG